jgi:hypothetical protein
LGIGRFIPEAFEADKRPGVINAEDFSNPMKKDLTQRRKGAEK